MNKHSTIKEQIKYISNNNISIIDENKIYKFLEEYPFQYSVKQIEKICSLEKFSNSNEIIEFFSFIKDDSYVLLNNILDIERHIKSIIFKNFSDFYSNDKAKYNNLIDDFIPISKAAFKYSLEKKCSIDAKYEEIFQQYYEKPYKIINTLSIDEVKKTIKIIDEKHIDELYNIIKQRLNIQKEAALKKQFFYAKEESEYLVNNYNKYIENIFVAQFNKIILESHKNNIYPIDYIKENKNLLVNLISLSKINKFFKDNIEKLIELKKSLDLCEQMSDKKEVIKNFSDTIIEFLEENRVNINKSIIDYYVNKEFENSEIFENKFEINTYINNIESCFRYKQYITIKFIVELANFRNTISHCQMITVNLMDKKEVIQKKFILDAFKNEFNINYVNI